MKPEADGEMMSADDALYWMKDPSLHKQRVYIGAETIQSIVAEHLKRAGINLDASNNIWLWNNNAPNGPELVLVQITEEA